MLGLLFLTADIGIPRYAKNEEAMPIRREYANFEQILIARWFSHLQNLSPDQLSNLVARYTRINSPEAGDQSRGGYRLMEIAQQVAGRIVPKSVEGQIAFGGATGCCSGYLTMKIGKTAAFTVGAALLLLQIAHYKGYVHVDWESLGADLRNRGQEFIQRHQVPELDSPSVVDFLNRNKHIAAGFLGGFLIGAALS